MTITHTGSDNGLAPNWWQAILWTNADAIHWRIYAALGRDELNDDTRSFHFDDLFRWFWFNDAIPNFMKVLHIHVTP